MPFPAATKGRAGRPIRSIHNPISADFHVVSLHYFLSKFFKFNKNGLLLKLGMNVLLSYVVTEINLMD